ncbi:MAG: hypothetical protein C4582_06690 [Desulfobacteraceae bacterium]|nr:MAG: hypothetical protein C4582_06690 [Desulfobacteraceae bacterium]
MACRSFQAGSINFLKDHPEKCSILASKIIQLFQLIIFFTIIAGSSKTGGTRLVQKKQDTQVYQDRLILSA